MNDGGGRWSLVPFGEALEVLSDDSKRLPQSEYLASGELPVVDQGEGLIGGYTDRKDLLFTGPLPVIVFGDHTRRFKLVTFPFVVGAQGVKLLRPRSGWNETFLLYALQGSGLPNRGYSRHFQFLRKISLPHPHRQEQDRIVAEIEKQLTRVDAGVDAIQRLQAHLRRYRVAVLRQAFRGSESSSTGWPRKPLGDVVEILDRLRVPVNADERELRQGPVPYYGATGQVGWIDKHIFDEELVLLGEDGAPFLDPAKPKAYLIRGKSWVNNHAHVLRGKGISNTFLMHQLNAIDYHGAVTGTTRLKLPQAPMKKLLMAVPPGAEQARIVSSIDRKLTQAEAIERAAANGLVRAARLRASVLRAAADGRLVRAEPLAARIIA